MSGVTNEELKRLNEELQAIVEELTATNAELKDRSTQLERAYQALTHECERSERQSQRLKTTIASMGDAVMMVDERGRSMLTNHAFDEIFAGIEGESVLEVASGEPMPSRDALQRRGAAGETFLDSFALLAPDGSRRWFEASGRPLGGQGGKRGGVVVIRDITDRGQRDLQNQFVAMVAHELRTPLTALSGYVELLRRHVPDDAFDERSRRYADRAVTQAHRMSELVADLLVANRLQREGLDYAFEPLDFANLVEEMAEASAPLGGEIEIRISGTSAPVPVIGDAGRLQQVVFNLISNAGHHGGSGGQIEVTLRRRGAAAELRVRDHGPGIPKADLPHLFSRFFQGSEGRRSRAGGLGLGLYIAHQIVEAHGGTIGARRPRGGGAMFVVTLPVAADK